MERRDIQRTFARTCSASSVQSAGDSLEGRLSQNHSNQSLQPRVPASIHGSNMITPCAIYCAWLLPLSLLQAAILQAHTRLVEMGELSGSYKAAQEFSEQSYCCSHSRARGKSHKASVLS